MPRLEPPRSLFPLHEPLPLIRLWNPGYGAGPEVIPLTCLIPEELCSSNKNLLTCPNECESPSPIRFAPVHMSFADLC